MQKKQIPRRIVHARRLLSRNGKGFDYSQNYSKLNLRKNPELYRVGVGEQGVLLVEPYKSEILPYWSFATVEKARQSSSQILSLFYRYANAEDFVGMDMSRKFLQMGFTRARRYANHRSGRKYAVDGTTLPKSNDAVKAAAAEVYFQAWQSVETLFIYQDLKAHWRAAFG